MPIITGGDSEFGRLVAEELHRRAQRVIALEQATSGIPQGQLSGHEGPAGGEDHDEDNDRRS